MHPDIQTKLENLPDNPGVYQFFDEAGKYLYIGKAKNLKNRVRSYFQKGDHSVRIGLMVKKIHAHTAIISTECSSSEQPESPCPGKSIAIHV